MPLQYAIRKAIVSDAALACEVVRRSISELCRDDHRGDADTIDAWLANKTVAKFESWIRSHTHLSVVAERRSELVGFGLLNLQGQLALLYVAPQARFQGVSKAILAFIEDAAVSAGIREVRLMSSGTARRFYLSCGYKVNGESRPGFGVTRSYPMSKQLLA